MEEKEVLVKVEGLSKKFCIDLRTSLWYGVKDLFLNLKGNKKERLLREKEFWALKDINFELQRGECLGLIGHNGAGKSTLLKILNGLIKPDEGKVALKGKVGAIIELGAGFNPLLTGRENIYNNGAILGFSRKQIDEKLDVIIDFAEIREFIDMPVRNYSSGMNVRLGFAIAAQMEPDILIIDEVLAVGDLGFVLKCFKTIDFLLPKTAIIFVSHSMPLVSRICNKIILLQKGKQIFQGNETGAAIDFYYSSFETGEKGVVFSDGTVKCLKAKLINFSSLYNNIPQIKWGETLSIHLKFHINPERGIPIFIIIIYDKEKREVAYIKENNPAQNLQKTDNILEFTINHRNLQLTKGFYSIDISVNAPKSREPYLRMRNALSFQLDEERDIYPPFLLESEFVQPIT